MNDHHIDYVPTCQGATAIGVIPDFPVTNPQPVRRCKPFTDYRLAVVRVGAPDPGFYRDIQRGNGNKEVAESAGL
jgi:hypothetical protein